MKTTALLLVLLLTCLGLRAQVPAAPVLPRPILPRPAPGNNPGAPGQPGVNPNAGLVSGALNGGNFSSLNFHQSSRDESPTNTINFQGVDVAQVLEIYAGLVGRTLLHGPLPQASIVFKTESPLTRSELIEALQTVLAMNGIQVINFGDKFVKVVGTADANNVGAPISDTDATNLPDLGPYVTHIVQLKYLKPSIVLPYITPFSKLPNAATAIDDNGLIVLRDNVENVKRMLEMIDRLDISIPTEYISEVIAIKYAQAADIANALNSLGGQGGGGGTVSIGNSPTGGRVSGLGGSGSSFNTGAGGAGGAGGSAGTGLTGLRAMGSTTQGAATTPNGTPSSGSTFQNRLNQIISSAGGGGATSGGKQEPIQVFGQTKIIADQRSNSLLVFATRQDMVNIKHVISQLDVLLSQVLIEAVIMDVTLGSSFNLGVSAAQNPQQYGTTAGGPILGGGGGNNGAALQSLIPGGLANAATNGAFAQNLGGGLNYYGNIGPNWDVAVSALAGENNATVIQRPRIQTSQAKPATFFVGNTVPYVTGTYYGGGYSGGNSSQYSQLTVGVELDVTPFINPDGLVVMDINQEIDDVNGSTAIEGVGNVPNTDKRTLSSEIAVRDRDTIMLGGFIRSDKSTSKSGVPVLQDIPLLGMLFSSRSDSKNREELIVLMRPTVLKTLDDSAAMTRTEERRLPGVSAAALDDNNYEQQLIAAERKAEAKRARASGETNGFYEENHTILQTDRIGLGTNAPVIPPPDVMVITNMPTYHSDETVPPVTPAPAVPNQ